MSSWQPLLLDGGSNDTVLDVHDGSCRLRHRASVMEQASSLELVGMGARAGIERVSNLAVRERGPGSVGAAVKRATKTSLHLQLEER